MSKYITEQRRVLTAFFSEHHDEQFSVEEITERLCESKKISVSSVYRNIDRLVKEGTLSRLADDSGHRFVYRYVGAEECRKHLHLKCTGCGCVMHMDESATDEILNAALKKSSFHIDGEKTMLYGLCDSCNKK